MAKTKEKKTVKRYVLDFVEVIGTGGLSVLRSEKKPHQNNGHPHKGEGDPK
jgi:hypothetical protein